MGKNMTIIKEPQELLNLPDDNRFIGELPAMTNSTVKFAGSNNILYCEKGVKMEGSSIFFNASNSIVYLSSSKFVYRLSAFINNNNVFYMGKNNSETSVLHVVLSEQKHCIIGKNGMFSREVWIRNADPHLIYNAENKARINPTKSVFIGDHVWIGQSATILKGTQIDSGSIIGAMSVVSGKKIPNNVSGAGNPYKQLSQNIFWSRECVHEWRENETALSQDFSKFVENKPIKPDEYIYTYDPEHSLIFDDIDAALFNAKSAEEKLAYLQKLSANNNKNRFVHYMPKPKKGIGGFFRK